VLSDPAFVSGVDVLVVVVDSVQVINGTGCAVVGWRYDWGEQRGAARRETTSNGET
jgi:hypothetical protein